MKVNNQIIKENYAIYEGDCMSVLPSIPNESVDMSAYSPPFESLYTYSSDARDFSNCDTREQFLTQYDYLIKEMARVTKKGRINAIHITEIVESNGSSFDLPNEVIRLHSKNGFDYKGRITIWKEPLKVRIRTMVQSLMHKFVVEDTTKCFPAQPDYLLLFKKRGEVETPVTHDFGLTHYAGDVPILPNMIAAYNNANKTNYTTAELWEHLTEKYKDWKDPKTNKLSHYIWQRYASSVWDDVRAGNVLPFRDAKQEDDEKHVTPTQLDVLDRCIDLWTNEGETVLTPFAGVGSEVYSAVSMGRKAIGIELKSSYFKQMIKNVEFAERRFEQTQKQSKLF